MLRRVRSGLHLGAGLRCANMRRPPSVKSGSVRPYYLKKRSGRGLPVWRRAWSRKIPPDDEETTEKVFCFFFSKKKAFLPK
jgi:hypothetical protein